jgi:hypothetical protein
VLRSIALLLLALMLAGAVPGVARAGEGVPIEVRVANGSSEALRCLMVFAHWTTLDLPVIAPGGHASLVLERAPDRALFIRRQDGRPMMLEALHCGHDGRWSQTLLKLDWTPPMLSDARAFRLACMGAQSLSCRWEEDR